MKPMISSLSALAAIVICISPSASALTCAQQAADLQIQQVKAQKMTETNQALAEEVEAAGAAWEDVEIHRLASAGHAATADEAKLIYDGLRAEFTQTEILRQELLVAFNQAVSAYNEACTKS
mgnify:CR=1 FL=1